VAIAVLTAGAAIGQAADPPIVFVHGNGDAAALWHTTIWRFEANGSARDRLFAIDLRFMTDNRPGALSVARRPSDPAVPRPSPSVDHRSPRSTQNVPRWRTGGAGMAASSPPATPDGNALDVIQIFAPDPEQNEVDDDGDG
jgi:pimeloyl-ACP methyl ester carboxylesterase